MFVQDYIRKCNSLSKKELAEIWNSLNYWQWNNKLGDKPEDWDDLPSYVPSKDKLSKSDIVSPINRYIENKIGHKECLRYLHIHVLKRCNNLQFEWWWIKRYLNNKLNLYWIRY